MVLKYKTGLSRRYSEAVMASGKPQTYWTQKYGIPHNGLNDYIRGKTNKDGDMYNSFMKKVIREVYGE